MIGIVNYNSGNFTSVFNTINYLGYPLKEVNTSFDFEDCTHIILPGVGTFNYAMEQLDKLNLLVPLKQHILQNKKFFLGICVGMQILAELGNENGNCNGLGWLRGSVEKFNFNGEDLRLPHIGWNTLESIESNVLLHGVNQQDPSFYFVHSYHYYPSDDYSYNIIYSNYGYNFPSLVQHENIFGVQFHPEKSQENGKILLKNFCELV